MERLPKLKVSDDIILPLITQLLREVPEYPSFSCNLTVEYVYQYVFISVKEQDEFTTFTRYYSGMLSGRPGWFKMKNIPTKDDHREFKEMIKELVLAGWSVEKIAKLTENKVRDVNWFVDESKDRVNK